MQPKKISKKLVIGITGSFGSGKSTVARYFLPYGFQVIDADKVAHSLLKAGTQTYKQVRRIFSQDVLIKGKQLNRKKIGEIVFKNKRLRHKLNQVIHPQVIRIIKNKIKASRAKAIILDVPLLIESGMQKSVDKVVVVKIKPREQIKRLEKKFSFCEADIVCRIKAQMPLSDKVRMADFVIDNSGSLKETRKQVGKLRRLLWKN
ncbi:MAG: dephospho-CoA kinase [Candidatus Omnitrophica bacterium]|nr:dephospho-CoA kinase [Candidatus Omnitrophota bacterium]